MKGMLSCSSLNQLLYKSFSKIKEASVRRRPISLLDNLLSGFALFSLKYPSLLQFNKYSWEEMVKHNLQTVFKIGRIPSDTQLR